MPLCQCQGLLYHKNSFIFWLFASSYFCCYASFSFPLCPRQSQKRPAVKMQTIKQQLYMNECFRRRSTSSNYCRVERQRNEKGKNKFRRNWHKWITWKFSNEMLFKSQELNINHFYQLSSEFSANWNVYCYKIDYDLRAHFLHFLIHFCKKKSRSFWL